MKHLVAVTVLLICNVSSAQNGSLNLALPSNPGSYQSDRFRSGELDCSMAIGSGTNIEFGVMGIINNNQTQTIINNVTTPNARDVGVYGRITIPIGGPKVESIAIDCMRWNCVNAQWKLKNWNLSCAT